MSYQIFELDNNIRVVHLFARNTRLVHCGIIIDAGSRDENSKNNGVAHFIEHAVFKATEKRKSHHILKRIESVGGEINAYTSREKTSFYASCLSEYAGRAIELLSDLTFNATFPEKELDKERRVILEELEMYEDSPEENIYDNYFQRLYPKHSLGFDVLGSRKTLPKISRNDILSFINQNYTNDKIVLSIVGNISANKAEKLARKYLSDRQNSHSKRKRIAPPPYQKFNIKEDKDFIQQHCIIGNRAYSKNDPKRFAMMILNNILGGYGMSSRLNMSIREKYGYTYNIGSNVTTFTDSGVFTIYLGTDQKFLKKCIGLVFKELKKLKTNKLGNQQLHTAKKQILGQMAIVQENNTILMQSMGKTILDYGRVISIDEFFNNIEMVTENQILEVANEIFNEEALSILIFKEKNSK